MGTLKKPVLEPQTFVAAVAHELKNPLSAVFGYADLLLETHIGEGLSEKQREVIERIRQTAAKSVDLVKNYQFLALHHREGSSATADLTAILGTVTDVVSRDSRRQISVSLEVSSMPLRVVGSPYHIERVVSNLVSNALKYTPPGGTVSIGTRLAEGKTIFQVHNTGSFIPPEEIAAVFAMYSRGKSAEQTRPGAGLGLFIVHTICTAIGASLDVESSEENGTTFTVRFETAPAE